jgi:hypothetical protein
MPTRLLRARTCAPAAALLLAACGPSGAKLVEVRAAAIDPPELWLAEALDADGRSAGAVKVCTDHAMREGFARANAEVDGQTCAPHRDAVQRDGLYAVRCELNGHPYGLTLNRSGDPARDFSVRFTLTALDGTAGAAAQTRRFRKLGPCPAGWQVGDQARLGAARGENALSGRWAGR